ncbi:Signal transduction histidine kinase [Acetitomaculum ruminis DSM 5522]|uniref:Stage 0 sporulation protein A homolog n=1 Tax=Acetitomaculum ruminis DSM 5522 TaxID=1120918 RepID=A0A1I0ZZT9_9FIRM|nr:ATP-binding protein [Acetitomaculum ruminis]SFB29910.1 Signal transduction histidine kinase [Acetitomaculum ruminis DSM 5522]
MFKKKRLFFIGGIIFIFFMCSFISSFAKEDEKAKTIKVGYPNLGKYESVRDDDYKTGYGYEYLQKISSITGWEYEYVYGSFDELEEKLEKEEIDLLGYLLPSEGNNKNYNYSDYPEGKEVFFIYVKAESSEYFTKSNEKALEGKKIGVLSDSYQSKLLEGWLGAYDLDAEVKNYKDDTILKEDFEKGLLDGIVSSNITADKGMVSVASLGNSEFYYGVAKNKTDVLEELNRALYKINVEEPYYNDTIYERYSIDENANNKLNYEEEAWLKKNNNTVRIGFTNENMPYSDTEDQEKKRIEKNNKNAQEKSYKINPEKSMGVISAIIDILENDFGINVEVYAYNTTLEMTNDFDNGKIDIFGPLFGDYWLGEKYGHIDSKNISEGTISVLYDNKTTFSKDLLKNIVVSETSMIQLGMCKVIYSDAEVTYAPSMRECIKMITDNPDKGYCTVVTTSKLSALKKYPEMDNINVTEVNGINDNKEGICFGVQRGEVQLLSIFNKAVSLCSNSLIINTSTEVNAYSLGDILRRNFSKVFGILMLILIFLALMFLFYIRFTILNKRALEEANIKIEKSRALAEEANNAKTVFLFNMSHDIRTPLNAIIGLTNLAQKHMDDSEKIKHYLKDIRYSGNHLLDVINSVLELAKIENGKAVLKERPTDISEFKDGIYAIFCNMAAEKNIDLFVEENITRPFLYIDKPKMEEILLNIINNAIKYTNEDGKIKVEILQKILDEDYCLTTLIVSDNGIGMSEEYKEHMFESFTRERTWESDNVQGTGLGLSIVKSYVDLMGGSIEVDSKVGCGTTIRIILKNKLAKGELNDDLEQEKIRKKVNFDNIRILLAEDNDLNAEIAGELLKDAGIEVERVKDGIECVEKIKDRKAHYYDMVLMDVQMPHLDGYGATAKIRKLDDENKSEIPIIAMTANVFEEDKKNAYDAGMNGHISKPIDVQILFEIINRFC